VIDRSLDLGSTKPTAKAIKSYCGSLKNKKKKSDNDDEEEDDELDNDNVEEEDIVDGQVGKRHQVHIESLFKKDGILKPAASGSILCICPKYPFLVRPPRLAKLHIH
jgi:hypothetical protein